MELVLEAGAASLAVDVDVAVADLEEAVDQLCRAVGRAGGKEGAVVEAAVLAHLAGDEDLGEGLLPGELHVGVALVVPQQDVEGRQMLVDEVVLQHQGLELRLADDELQVPDAGHQAAGLGIQVLVLEVGLHPVPQHLGLADVEQVPLLVAIEVAARTQGQVRQLALEGGGLVEVVPDRGHGLV